MAACRFVVDKPSFDVEIAKAHSTNPHFPSKIQTFLLAFFSNFVPSLGELHPSSFDERKNDPGVAHGEKLGLVQRRQPGTRRSRSSPIHLSMIPEDADKYIVRGKWHARLPVPPLSAFAASPGGVEFGPFFLRESRSRLNAGRKRRQAYLDLPSLANPPCASTKTPFVMPIVYRCGRRGSRDPQAEEGSSRGTAGANSSTHSSSRYFKPRLELPLGIFRFHHLEHSIRIISQSQFPIPRGSPSSDGIPRGAAARHRFPKKEEKRRGDDSGLGSSSAVIDVHKSGSIA
ncbi:hypothetical protein KM043_008462 [Ampulex compressa]|nr:hypothetical protein KM043_008462 [Ampulex compressa]